MNMTSRIGAVVYHEVACGSSVLYDTLCRKGSAGSCLCRAGCGVAENMEHVLYHCPRYARERDLIDERCRTLGVTGTTSELMTNCKLQPLMEALFDSVGLTKSK